MEKVTQIQFIDTFGTTGPQGIIDVDTGTQFPINFSVGDVRDPFSKKGTKSYKFEIVGSKENNKLMNNYYDINIVDGTYNNNKKQKIAVLRNGVVILDNGYMQLLRIKKKGETSVFSDDQISFEVEVGDDATSFFTDITNKYLEDLNFQDMNHVYEAVGVIGSFGNSSIRNKIAGTGGYKYVLPWTPLNKYRLEECRPAISVYEYWNRIHQAAGYQWTWNDFDSSEIRMDKLWIPYNGDKPKMGDQTLSEVAAETVTPFTRTGAPFPGFMTQISPYTFICDVEVLDALNSYNPVTGIYTAPFYSGATSLNATFKISYEFRLVNPSGGTAYLSETGGLPTVDKFWTWRSQCRMFNNTTSIFSPGAAFSTDKIVTTPTTAFSVAPGVNVISSGTVTTGTIPVTGISLNDQLSTSINTAVQSNDTTIRFKSSVVGGASIAVAPQLYITKIEMILQPNLDTYGYLNIINMNDFVPAQIKQSDFIKAVANMYNLVITPDPTNEKNIIYTLRDKYYDAGANKDWTLKLAKDKDGIVSFISSTNAKKTILSYKPDTDVVNKDYLAETKEVYGQQQYTLQNENIKGLEIKEILFSPTPVDNTSFGTVNPMWVGQTPKCNIRILIDGGVQPTAGTMTYSIIDYTAGTTDFGVTGINTYPMLTHQDNPNTPAFDINFGLCDKYYNDFASVTNNNLYTMFWRRTIGQIDSGKLFEAYFELNEYDISILKLNDKIFVKDTWYNINTLQYDPNSFGPTKAMLMTIDDELAIGFPKPPREIGKPILGTLTTATLSDQIYTTLNWNYADSSVRVMGTGNAVPQGVKNVLVVGDNRSVEESNTISAERIVVDRLVVQGKTLDFGNPITIGYRVGNPGDNSVVIGGNEATGLEASGLNAFATGDNSIASGQFAIVMGQDSVASGDYSWAAGNTSLATGTKSFASGGNATANHFGEYARAAFFFANQADAQHGNVNYGNKSTGAAPLELFLDGSAQTQRFTIPFNSNYAVEIRGVAVDLATGDTAMWTGKGIVKDVAGTVSLVAPIVPIQDAADASMIPTVLAVAAVANYLEITGTGIAATNIYWNITLNYTKIGL